MLWVFFGTCTADEEDSVLHEQEEALSVRAERHVEVKRVQGCDSVPDGFQLECRERESFC